MSRGNTDKENPTLHDILIETLQASLDEAQAKELDAKVDAYLDTSRGDFLDRFGSWLGLYRKNTWKDDYYRDRIKKHVLTGRGTINNIRMGLANFLETEIKNIYIYEPYVDMFILNKSLLNGKDRLSSPYYRYAVIDINIDAPIKSDITDIINLFRPAGVVWVLTNDINGLRLDAPIIDMILPRQQRLNLTNYGYYGWLRNNNYDINPGIDDAVTAISNPFIYNDDKSLLNDGKLYYANAKLNQNYTYLGQLFQDFTPEVTDTFADTRAYAEQYETSKAMSSVNGKGKDFSLEPEKVNLVQNANPTTYILSGIDGTQAGSISSSDYRNMLFGTSSELTTKSLTNAWNVGYPATNGDLGIKAEASKNYYYQVYIDNSKGTVPAHAVVEYASSVSGTDRGVLGNGNIIEAGSSGYSGLAVKVNEDCYLGLIPVSFGSASTTTVSWKEEQLELGTTATVWTPNASEATISYKLGIRAKSNSTTSEPLVVSIPCKDNTYQTITKTIASSFKDYPQYFTATLDIPATFVSDGVVSLSYNNLDVESFSITSPNSNAPTYYALNPSQEQTYYGLGSAVDLKRYIQNYAPEIYNSDFNTVLSNFSYFNVNTNIFSYVSTTTTLWLYNFNLNLWVNFNSYKLNRNWNYLKIKIDNILPYLNDNGILFYKMTFTEPTPVTINYFGLTFGYTTKLEDIKSANGMGLTLYQLGYLPRIDPTTTGAHLYLDYKESYTEF